MSYFLALMLISLLFPLVQSWRCRTIRERMLCYTSISTRAAVCLLFFARRLDDAMIGLVAVIVLCLGNSGLMFLVNLTQGLEEECE